MHELGLSLLRDRGGGDPGSRGRTTIADGVVEKIAGLAARDVDGVHAMGSGLSRTFGAVRDRVPGGTKSVARGVKAEVGEVQAALDLEIVWLPVGTQFRIDEYDGSESLETAADVNWSVA